MIIEIILIVLFELCILGRNNKYIYLTFSAVMFLFMAFNTYNADYSAYSHRYRAMNSIVQVLATDSGFGFLMLFVKKLGFSYQNFIGVVSIIGLFLTGAAYRKYSKISCIQLIVYFMMSYYTHTVQLRTYIAEWIVILAILQLLKEGNVKKYLIYVLIASTFHYSSIVFAVFAVPSIVKNKKLAFMLLLAFAVLLPFLFELFLRFSPASAEIRMEIYFTEAQRRGIKSYLFVFLFVSMTFLMRLLSKMVGKRGDLEYADLFSRIADYDTINWFSLALILLYSNNFFRLNRPMIIITVMYLLEYYLAKRFRIVGSTILLLFGFPLVFIVSELAQHVWYDAATTNMLFQYLGLI